MCPRQRKVRFWASPWRRYSGRMGTAGRSKCQWVPSVWSRTRRRSEIFQERAGNGGDNFMMRCHVFNYFVFNDVRSSDGEYLYAQPFETRNSPLLHVAVVVKWRSRQEGRICLLLLWKYPPSGLFWRMRRIGRRGEGPAPQ